MTNAFTVDTPTGPIAGHAAAPGGPDLLLLHGGPGVADYMGLLDDETAGWRTIRYQQRGLAPSTVDGPFTVEQHVADALAVLDGLHVARAVVLGSSWGVHLALRLASAAPDRVAAVICVDGLGPDGDGMAPAMFANQVARLTPAAQQELAEVSDRGAALRLLWPSYFADPAHAPDLPPGMDEAGAGADDTIESMFADMADGRFADQLRALTVPAVVLVGEASPIPNEAGEQLAQLLPGAEFVRVPGAGHLPWLERPGCVASVLDRVRPD